MGIPYALLPYPNPQYPLCMGQVMTMHPSTIYGLQIGIACILEDQLSYLTKLSLLTLALGIYHEVSYQAVE